jgi:rubredoxin
VTVTAEEQQSPETQKWICETCGYVYDPVEGDEDGGIPRGTPFGDVPKDWFCPVCGARKKDFKAMEPGEDVPAETW